MQRTLPLLCLAGLFLLPAPAHATPDRTIDYDETPFVADPQVLDDPLTGFHLSSGTAEQAGAISEINGPRSLVKLGGGTLIFSGENSYTGTTHIAEGTLEAAADLSIPELSAVVIDAGAIFRIAGETTEVDWLEVTIGSLEGAGSVDLGTGAILNVGEDNRSTHFSGTLTSSGPNTIFSKTGLGTLTLTGTSSINGLLDLCGCSPSNRLEIIGGSFTATDGATLDGGTVAILGGGSLVIEDFMRVTGDLIVSGTGSTVQATDVFIGHLEDETSEVTFSDGGQLTADSITLGFNGILRGEGVLTADTLVETGGVLAPGPSGLTFNGGLAFETETFLELTLGQPGAAITVTDGLLTAEEDAEILLRLTAGVGFTAGTYTFLDATGGTLGDLALENFLIDLPIEGYTLTLIQSGSQFQIVAEAIPEPSHLLLGGFAAFALWQRQRRRRAASSPLS